MASDPLLTHKGALQTPDESSYWDRKEEHASLKHILNIENSSSSNSSFRNRLIRTKQK